MPSTQSAEPSARQVPERFAWIALALAAIAGSVDGIGYLLLYHIFTSHMSGNTVAMTMHVAQGDWPETWRRIQPILAFFAGICGGLALTDILTERNLLRLFSVVAGLEALLLIAFYLLAKPPMQWMVVFPACAMGIQNAMLRRAGHHRVRTTFITGMLTNTAQGLVDGVRALLARSGDAQEKFSDFALYGGIWLCFAAGGILGAFLDVRYGSVALWLPIGGLAALIALDLVTPLTKDG